MARIVVSNGEVLVRRLRELAELADEKRHYQPGYEPGRPLAVVLDEGTVYAGLAPGERLTPIARHEPPQREDWRTRTPNAGPIAKE